MFWLSGSAPLGPIEYLIVAVIGSRVQSVNQRLLLLMSHVLELLGTMLLSQFDKFHEELGVRFDRLIEVLPGYEFQRRLIEIRLVRQQVE